MIIYGHHKKLKMKMTKKKINKNKINLYKMTRYMKQQNVMIQNKKNILILLLYVYIGMD